MRECSAKTLLMMSSPSTSEGVPVPPPAPPPAPVKTTGSTVTAVIPPNAPHRVSTPSKGSVTANIMASFGTEILNNEPRSTTVTPRSSSSNSKRVNGGKNAKREENDLVEAKVSSIPSAGMGLFAKCPISANAEICEYSGELLNLQQAKSLRDRTYLKAINLCKHINAGVPNGSIGKYINDHPDPGRRNVKFVTRKEQIFVVATRDVAAGEELFIEYGRGHWLFCGVGVFLGLELDSAHVLRATQLLKPREVVCVYSSRAMVDADGLSQGIQFATSFQDERANCRLKPNPFVNQTVMVGAERTIHPGEAIVVRAQDRLAVKTSKISGAGLGAFALTKLSVDNVICEYSGTPVTLEEFESKVSRFPNVALYGFAVQGWSNLDVNKKTVIIDPTDSKGQVRPFFASHACFVNRGSQAQVVNCKFKVLDNDRVLLLATRDIAAGEEMYANYEDFLK